ncbi:MAG TPA: ARMT1-like domain-containing protein [Tangfeifania sp.]|nr:ARMT1-like domain-containing protein [Tangfeifania sp.]
MNYECLICQVKALEKRVEKYEIPAQKRNRLVSELLKKIAVINLEKSYSPEITSYILNILKDSSEIADPYLPEKMEGNREMLERYKEFREMIQQSENPFNTALRLAVAGNIIDFGPTHIFDVTGTIEKVLVTDFAIDHSEKLQQEIRSAGTILYLGDNSGEIVLDKLFLETLNHPDVWFAVREQPVLNDVTRREAEEVGIGNVARIISNGDDAPSTLLHRVSDKFRQMYQKADLIISKGMGNYEGLMFENDPRLFFLLMVKCDVIGRKIGASKGDFIVKHN